MTDTSSPPPYPQQTPVSLPELELQQVARMSAQSAVHETFRHLGVDLNDQQQVNEFRADLVWSRRNRKMSEQVGGRALLTIVSIATGAFLMAGWELLKHRLGGN
jgi:hypothetical protein